MTIKRFESEEFVPIFCTTWKSTLFSIVADGIEIKCKSCRGEIHHISRERLEQEWAELDRLHETILKIAS